MAGRRGPGKFVHNARTVERDLRQISAGVSDVLLPVRRRTTAESNDPERLTEGQCWLEWNTQTDAVKLSAVVDGRIRKVTLT